MGLLGSVKSNTQEGTKHDLHNPDFAPDTVYGSKFSQTDIPRYEMPEEEMPGGTAYQLVSQKQGDDF